MQTLLHFSFTSFWIWSGRTSRSDTYRLFKRSNICDFGYMVACDICSGRKCWIGGMFGAVFLFANFFFCEKKKLRHGRAVGSFHRGTKRLNWKLNQPRYHCRRAIRLKRIAEFSPNKGQPPQSFSLKINFLTLVLPLQGRN